MKFEDMQYKRIDLAQFTAQAEKTLAAFHSADTAAAQLEAIRAFFDLWQHFRTMHNLAYFRHTGNTLDEFYSGENDYYDEAMPQFEGLENRFNKAITVSRFRSELENALGNLLFKNIEISLRAFDEKLMDDMAEENRLKSQYQKLIAAAQIEFEGKTLNLSQLGF